MDIVSNELFIKIVGAIITILVAIVTSVIIPWIKDKIGSEKLGQLDYYIEKAVRCANQVYSPDEWALKKEFVYNYICNVINDKLNLSLTNEDINTLIEGAVNSVKALDK